MPPPTNAAAVGLDDGVVDCRRARIGGGQPPTAAEACDPPVEALFETVDLLSVAVPLF